MSRYRSKPLPLEPATILAIVFCALALCFIGFLVHNYSYHEEVSVRIESRYVETVDDSHYETDYDSDGDPVGSHYVEDIHDEYHVVTEKGEDYNVGYDIYNSVFEGHQYRVDISGRPNSGWTRHLTKVIQEE